jgi:arabinose-5-phosphate isomerase
VVKSAMPMTEVLPIMSEKKFGIAIVMDDDFNVTGVITDGDLRRYLLKGVNLTSASAADCMTGNPLCIGEDNLAVEALKIMESKLITSLVVLENKRLKGLLHLHDLWRTEMI